MPVPPVCCYNAVIMPNMCTHKGCPNMELHSISGNSSCTCAPSKAKLKLDCEQRVCPCIRNGYFQRVLVANGSNHTSTMIRTFSCLNHQLSFQQKLSPLTHHLYFLIWKGLSTRTQHGSCIIQSGIHIPIGVSIPGCFYFRIQDLPLHHILKPVHIT